MMLTLGLILLSTAIELLLWLPPVWRYRKVAAYFFLILIAAASGTLLAARLSVWTALLAMVSVFRSINLLRVIEGRIQAVYLFRGTQKTALYLIIFQLVIFSGAWAQEFLKLNALTWWYLLAVGQLLTAAMLLASTLRHIRTTGPPSNIPAQASRDLPSLTVAIPARNETTDLEACLESLLKSTYPKLEILVLDDCSQDRHTPEIIRSFAHDGVRFIAGNAPSEQWQPKNYAYAQLAAEANGELLLFCGVDTRFEPDSLSALVQTMLHKQKTMVSVLPHNFMPEKPSLLSLFIQPNRYAWEIALPRRILARPPVLSTCWLISRKVLEAAGGFEAVRRKGVPESYFAKVVAANHDGYSFLQSNSAIGISCQKSLVEQQATAIRTRYLQLHRRPELVLIVALAEFTELVWPLIMLAAAAVAHAWLLVVLTGLTMIMTMILHGKIINLTYRRFLPGGFIILPLAALYDIGLLNYSMWQYEFSEVLWKGRNVCVPIMRVISPRSFTANLEQK